jgi:hypothetical protein
MDEVRRDGVGTSELIATDEEGINPNPGEALLMRACRSASAATAPPVLSFSC